MEQITKDDLKEALADVARKDDLKNLSTKGDLKKEIELIHDDLVKHDENMEKAFAELKAVERIEKEWATMKTKLREKLGVEV
jgi:hypothetical protein